MDQESFRKLLATPGAGSSTSTKSRASFLPTGSQPKSTKPTAQAAQPAFKPRKVKKDAGEYRDRAAERRVGDSNDEYADARDILAGFKQRTDQEESPSADLSNHAQDTLHVKGLDFALLEANKRRAAGVASAEAEKELDGLLSNTDALSTKSKTARKATREALLEKLKSSKDKVEKSTESKFKPVGFRPIGEVNQNPEETTTTSKKKKKKKRVVAIADEKPELIPVPAEQAAPVESSRPEVPLRVSTDTVHKAKADEDDDYDIFGDAGEYEGEDLGSDSEEEGQVPTQNETESSTREMDKDWFGQQRSQAPAEENIVANVKPTRLSPAPKDAPSGGHALPREQDISEDEEDHIPTRLVPLSSSAIPSIKELLAADSEGGKKKNKKRKKGPSKGDGDDEDEEDGNSKESKMTAEERAERDYKRLKSYTDKKASQQG